MKRSTLILMATCVLIALGTGVNTALVIYASSGALTRLPDGELRIADPDLPHDAPAFLANCVRGQVSGSYYSNVIYETVINESCDGGIHTYARVVVNEHNDQAEVTVGRDTCTEGQTYAVIGCTLGFFGAHHVQAGGAGQVAGMYVRTAADSRQWPAGNIPSFPSLGVTDHAGTRTGSAAGNPGSGWSVMVHPGKLPDCTLPGEHEAVFTFYWRDDGQLGVMGPDCSLKVVTMTPAGAPVPPKVTP